MNTVRNRSTLPATCILAWLLALYFGAGPALAQPGAGSLGPQKPTAGGISTIEPVRADWPSGTKIVLLPHHKVPMFSVTAILQPGSLTDPSGKEGLTSLTAGMLRRGAGTKDAAQFAAAVDALGASLGTAADAESVSIAVEGLTEDTEALLDLLADAMLRPRFDEDAFTNLRSQRLDALRVDKSNPPQVIRRYFQRWVLQTHPYGRASSGNEATLSALTAADCRAHYEAHFGADRLTLVAAGHFDADTLTAQLKARFSDWRPATQAAPPPPAAPVRSVGRVLLVDSPSASQVYFMFGQLGASADYPHQEALDVAHALFGGRFTSMLNTALRIETGLTYGARAVLSQPRGPGFSGIYSFTRTESAAEALQLALSTLDRMRETGFDAAQVRSAVATIRGQYPTGFETAPQWAGALAELEVLGLPLSRITGYLDRLSAVDAAAATRAGRDVFADRNALNAVLIGNADALRPAAEALGVVTEISIDTPWF